MTVSPFAVATAAAHGEGPAAPFLRSLERVAELCPDPAPLVYARLFAASPDLEPLFVRDRSFQVRGQMLAVALETLLDLAGPRLYAAGMLQSERTNHDGLGVPSERFDSFFLIVMATFRDVLGPEWTPDIEAAWQALTAEAQALLAG
jgi:hemoglobin-like flavoprotein